jgi:hypothetical protein
MSNLREPDDVDFFVGGVEVDAATALETLKAIEEYKKRPDYRSEVEEAERILSALRINAHDYGMPDAKALLDHWRRCVADPQKATHRESIDQDKTSMTPVSPSETQQ